MPNWLRDRRVHADVAASSEASDPQKMAGPKGPAKV